MSIEQRRKFILKKNDPHTFFPNLLEVMALSRQHFPGIGSASSSIAFAITSFRLLFLHNYSKLMSQVNEEFQNKVSESSVQVSSIEPPKSPTLTVTSYISREGKS